MSLMRVRQALRLSVAAAVVAVVMALSGGAGERSGSDLRPALSGTASATTKATSSGRPTGLGEPTARAAAQLFLIGVPGEEADDEVLERVTSREWGGIVLEPTNIDDEAQVEALVDGMRRAVRRADHLPPLVAAVETPFGRGMLPPQAEAGDAAEARAQALEAAERLRGVGVRMAMAPTADIGVTTGPWDGRAFADDARSVAELAPAAVDGWAAADVAAAPGHFPGEGGASRDPARGGATVGQSLTELRRRDLKPFAAIAAKAPAIQLSSASYVAFDGVTPATLLPEVVRLLREELRFRGVVVSGDLAAAAMATGQPIGEVAVQALKAGSDLLWVPGDGEAQQEAVRAVIQAIRRREVSIERVVEARDRIRLLRATHGVR